MKIITTVGTSLIENYEKENGELAKDLKGEVFYDNKNFLEDYKIDHKVEKLKKFLEMKDNACAELSTINLIEKNLKLKDYKIHLIVTDTLEGYLVAKTLKEFYKEKVIFDENNDIIKNLNIDKSSYFREGISNLIKRLQNIYYESCVFNISGGYKALIPYITVFSFINYSKLFYTFEESNELLNIPSLPVNIDYELLFKHKNILAKLQSGIENKSLEEFKKENKIFDERIINLIDEIKMEDEVIGIELNPIGQIGFEKMNSYYYVKIAVNSPYLKENEGNKKQIDSAILELIERLYKRMDNQTSLIQILKKLSDKDDLTHGGVVCTDKFIFKSTNKEHIRILYKPIMDDNGEIILEIYDIKRGSSNFNHSKYIEEWKKMCSKFENIDFIPYTIKKRS